MDKETKAQRYEVSWVTGVGNDGFRSKFRKCDPLNLVKELCLGLLHSVISHKHIFYFQVFTLFSYV